MSFTEQEESAVISRLAPCLVSHNLVQVLSNADLRAKYDAHGVEGLDVNFMDTAEFFSMLFGSESFDHLLGELSLARMTRYVSNRHWMHCCLGCLSVEIIAYERSICHAVEC